MNELLEIGLGRTPATALSFSDGDCGRFLLQLGRFPLYRWVKISENGTKLSHHRHPVDAINTHPLGNSNAPEYKYSNLSPSMLSTTSLLLTTDSKNVSKGCYRHLLYVRPCCQTSVPISRPLSFRAHNIPPIVAESVKAGVQTAGGSAKIFQYVLSFLNPPSHLKA